jgi:hypothetical protein
MATVGNAADQVSFQAKEPGLCRRAIFNSRYQSGVSDLSLDVAGEMFSRDIAEG